MMAKKAHEEGIEETNSAGLEAENAGSPLTTLFDRQRYLLHRTKLFVYGLTDSDGDFICQIKRPEAQTAGEDLVDSVLDLVAGRDGLGKGARALASTIFTFETSDGSQPIVMSKDTGFVKVSFGIYDAQRGALGYLVYQTFKLKWSIQDPSARELAMCKQPLGLFGTAAPTDYKIISTAGKEIAIFRANSDRMHSRDRWDIRILDPAVDQALLIGLAVASDFIVPR